MYKKACGFTIVELIVVIIVIGILTSVTTAAFFSQQKSSRDAKRKADIVAIKKEIDDYYDKKHEYPEGDDAAFWGNLKNKGYVDPFFNPTSTYSSQGSAKYCYSYSVFYNYRYEDVCKNYGYASSNSDMDMPMIKLMGGGECDFDISNNYEPSYVLVWYSEEERTLKFIGENITIKEAQYSSNRDPGSPLAGQKCVLE